MTQEPLYPEGHPKRIQQDSQRNNTTTPSYSKKKKKKKNDKILPASGDPGIEKPPDNDNEVSISDVKLNLVMNNHLLIMKKIMMRFMNTLKQIIKKQTMMLRQSQQLILITHNPRIHDMIKEALLLENTVKKENRGLKNLCLFHLPQLKRMMMKNLNALLKCRGQSFCALAD